MVSAADSIFGAATETGVPLRLELEQHFHAGEGVDSSVWRTFRGASDSIAAKRDRVDHDETSGLRFAYRRRIQSVGLFHDPISDRLHRDGSVSA